MRNTTPPQGLTFHDSFGGLPIFDAGLSFFMAGCIVVLSLLPLGAEKRDPYPWGFGAIAWTIAAVVAFGGVAALNRMKAVTLDREKGVVILWSVFFGRRREHRIPLSGFTQIGVQTWIQTGRGGVARCYQLDLRGPKQRQSLGEYIPANTVENIRVIADYLKLPMTVENRDPDREPRSEFRAADKIHPGLATALDKICDEVYLRYEGPSPESIARLTAFGKEAFDAALLATKRQIPPGGVDGKTCGENWDDVFMAFARINPRWLVEAFDRDSSGSQLFSFVWILSYVPDAAIAPDLLRWLAHRDYWIRSYCLQGLIKLRWEPAIPVMLDYLDKHPRREDVSDIIEGMLVWDALRQPRAMPALRLVINHLEKKKDLPGVLDLAKEALNCLEKGIPPAPRPPSRK